MGLDSKVRTTARAIVRLPRIYRNCGRLPDSRVASKRYVVSDILAVHSEESAVLPKLRAHLFGGEATARQRGASFDHAALAGPLKVRLPCAPVRSAV
jgi:hypothetical protein